MSLNYKKLKVQKHNFLQLTGVKVEEFDKIVELVKPLWQSTVESKKKTAGRTARLKTIEDKVLCVLIYYRTYITHSFLGYLFNLHNANICRLIKKIEPLLAKKITITKDRSLTPEKVLKLLADVSEQPTQRPKRKQKKTYSGKKKQHTLKTEIVIEETGKILAVSKSYKGRVHDFRIRKQEKLLPVNSVKYGDSGYQGWQKLQANVVIPFKRSKKKPLNQEQKEHNKRLASFRMRVEHKIRQIKIFRIMAYTYRNFQKKYGMRFNIIAGIVNLKYTTA
jgi:hypothetical protein